jgi:hypothetical protein
MTFNAMQNVDTCFESAYAAVNKLLNSILLVNGERIIIFNLLAIKLMVIRTNGLNTRYYED